MLWPWRGMSTSYSSAQKVRVAYTCTSTTGCKSGPKRVIHYSLSARMRSFKTDCENWSGQNRTSRTACYGHVIEIVTFSITYPTMSTHTMVRYQQYVGPVSYITFDQSVQGSKRLLVASESGVLAAINTRTGNISKDSLRHIAVWLHPPSFLEYQ